MALLTNATLYLSIALGSLLLFSSIAVVTRLSNLPQKAKKPFQDSHKQYLLITRIYFVYALLTQLLFVVFYNFVYISSLNLLVFVFPAVVQTVLLVYMHTLLRSFFSTYPKLKNFSLLQVGFFLWMVLVLLIGVDQIVRVPLFTVGIVTLLTGNTEILQSPAEFSLIIFFFTLAISFYGEYILRKVTRK